MKTSSKVEPELLYIRASSPPLLSHTIRVFLPIMSDYETPCGLRDDVICLGFV